MSDIFISYAHQDRPRAQTLAQTLEGRGWSTFWDRTIPSGKTWRETIGKELNGARCVIGSKSSIESRWVQEEADDANRRGVLVPVLIEDVQPPIGFRSIQAAHLENWGGAETTQAFPRLIADIAALIGLPPIEAGTAGADEELKLGKHYDYAKDYARAREWYEKAAAKGDATAMTNLGQLYHYGRGVAQDYAKAREWYEKAAAKGDATAMTNLGFLYQGGEGVVEDWAKAREWYKQAYAKETDTQSRRFLKGLIRNMSEIVWEDALTQKVKSGISALIKKFLRYPQ
jgi:tetratricopeptide (TPR) repeat protein